LGEVSSVADLTLSGVSPAKDSVLAAFGVSGEHVSGGEAKFDLVDGQILIREEVDLSEVREEFYFFAELHRQTELRIHVISLDEQ